VQGAAVNPATGKLWTIEHGARGGDEINIPEAGRNYGWPVISYGRNYDFTKIGIGTHKEGMEQPRYYWDPSIAPSGARTILGCDALLPRAGAGFRAFAFTTRRLFVGRADGRRAFFFPRFVTKPSMGMF